MAKNMYPAVMKCGVPYKRWVEMGKPDCDQINSDGTLKNENDKRNKKDIFDPIINMLTNKNPTTDTNKNVKIEKEEEESKNMYIGLGILALVIIYLMWR